MSRLELLLIEWLTKPKYDFMHGAVLVKRLGELSYNMERVVSCKTSSRED